ncbi:uncharacterized protein VP01_1719g1 [Puccinia sorghi]|uniref:Uncharacterized protein n=1 Tax=Puccinia sorghi TaxID=27349 RepID=A0A0L6VG19_9BASI|nr:uncharacterized protein VP01_1719g1 [Puccinia sorghi]
MSPYLQLSLSMENPLAVPLLALKKDHRRLPAGDIGAPYQRLWLHFDPNLLYCYDFALEDVIENLSGICDSFLMNFLFNQHCNLSHSKHAESDSGHAFKNNLRVNRLDQILLLIYRVESLRILTPRVQSSQSLIQSIINNLVLDPNHHLFLQMPHIVLTRIFSTRFFKYLIPPILCAPHSKVSSPSKLHQLVSQTNTLLKLALLTLLYHYGGLLGLPMVVHTYSRSKFRNAIRIPLHVLLPCAHFLLLFLEDRLAKNRELNQALPVHSLPHLDSVSVQLLENLQDISQIVHRIKCRFGPFGESMVIYYEYLIIIRMLSQHAARHLKLLQAKVKPLLVTSHWVGRLILWQQRSVHASK